MARVTVEDCITKIPNRFKLVMMASQRARQLSQGAPLTVARDNDKNAVVALREIADETVNVEQLQEAVIKNYQTTSEPDIVEEGVEDFALTQQRAISKESGMTFVADDDDDEADDLDEPQKMQFEDDPMAGAGGMFEDVPDSGGEDDA